MQPAVKLGTPTPSRALAFLSRLVELEREMKSLVRQLDRVEEDLREAIREATSKGER